ncbi:hypothetical protein CBR_g56846 [Chara braunii]|uniref:IAA-alanine resistance protein 1 n=1 Tax=Chara braunii TaxID=69332 RepID=A0A388MDS0_CHABU|nr:hypothetical protein CBR_g56846 [Chara braunii]|eukprot:GBG92707.1 hypothetical protein CBR_g56846 [Chara braunii]
MEALGDSDGEGGGSCWSFTSTGGRQEERRGRKLISAGRRRRWGSCAVGVYSFAAISAVVLLLSNCRVTVEGHAGCSFHSHDDDHHPHSHDHSHDHLHDHSHEHSHYSHESHGHNPYDHRHDSSSVAAGDDRQEPSDHGHASGIHSSISHDRQNPFHTHDYAHGYRSLAQFPDEMDDYHDGDSKGEEDDDDHVDGELHPRGIGLWVRAMASSLAVSLASLICLAILPFILAWGKGPSQRAVDLLAAFGVGAMLGDALLHQLPHAFGSGGHSHAHEDHGHDHGHTHSHSHTHAHLHTHLHSHSPSHGHSAAGAHAHSLADLSVGLSVLVGIFLFFVVEKIVRRTEELGISSSHAHGHRHSHKRKAQEPAELVDGSTEAKESGAVSDKALGDDKGDSKGNKSDEGNGEEKDRKEGKARRKRKGKKEEGKDSQEASERGIVEGCENGNGDSNAKSEPERGGSKAEKNDDNSASVDTRPIKEDDDDSGVAKKADETTVEKQPAGIRRRRKSGKTGSKTTEERLSGGEVPDGSPAKEDDSDAKDGEKKPRQVEGHEVEKHAQTSTGVSASPSLAVLGYLNLFSDGVHNFTDGMALASAFMHHGSVGGWSRTLFILAHELPQEVGDFGILLRAGFSVTKALTLNFLSALLAMAGTAAGNDLKTSMLQLTAMGAGVGIALAISLWE